MEQVRRETVIRMLFERKMEALRISKNAMKQLFSGEERETFGAGLESGDLSVAFQNGSMQSMRLNSQWNLIREIDRALKLLEDGTYGICEECNDEISEDRLSIVPFALYCQVCQETIELERKKREVGSRLARLLQNSLRGCRVM
ncbi:MAG: TraR/DksA C4-type zinc finger protein [Thermodesulfovibrionales bacterium]|jgi:DnaK suppressor protein